MQGASFEKDEGESSFCFGSGCCTTKGHAMRPKTRQGYGLLPTHMPFWHVSVGVAGFPSSHGVPLVLNGLVHTPVLVMQVPARWH